MEITGYKNIVYTLEKGLTHSHVRVSGDPVNAKLQDFVADFYILNRTKHVCIARINTKNYKLLHLIQSHLLPV